MKSDHLVFMLVLGLIMILYVLSWPFCSVVITVI